ncbi:hypothetical protein H6P81_004882 [Aristolochia fimbriata]|uniref:Uncharacterized protein n=1 Tax=Aristolochia fimbriata TaxID=158543 RepID=A0AAV7ETE9_ARIFI|nr:hypothetical protein H6P81_004882 [Aristolochia fimbriata]
METLVLSQHRNQQYSRSKSQFSDRFGYSPSRGFRDINCRTFQSGGVLSSPIGLSSYDSPPKTKRASSFLTPLKGTGCYSRENVEQDKNTRSSAIPISPSPNARNKSCSEDFSYSELWAGPAYSNSPPPSSLPMPKFSLRQKRSISLEIPSSACDVTLYPTAKSAPSSPTREEPFHRTRDFVSTTASATENLRRILHLDISDD